MGPSIRVGMLTRRKLLGGAAVIVAIGVAPSTVLAGSEQLATEIKKLVGDRKAAEGRIKIDLPTIAENGLVVPLSFEVESPMTEADHVRAVHIFAEGNPNPVVASFHFTPLAPKAAASIRIRLAETQKVSVIAEMSSGDVFMAAREVKVTIGGCGG